MLCQHRVWLVVMCLILIILYLQLSMCACGCLLYESYIHINLQHGGIMMGMLSMLLVDFGSSM
jgi:hypothetical protein